MKFKESLEKDVQKFVSEVVRNNPFGLSEILSSQGIDVEGIPGLYNKMMEFYNNGDARFELIYQVPVVNDGSEFAKLFYGNIPAGASAKKSTWAIVGDVLSIAGGYLGGGSDDKAPETPKPDYTIFYIAGGTLLLLAVIVGAAIILRKPKS
jgi:hypothetical protein